MWLGQEIGRTWCIVSLGSMAVHEMIHSISRLWQTLCSCFSSAMDSKGRPEAPTTDVGASKHLKGSALAFGMRCISCSGWFGARGFAA